MHTAVRLIGVCLVSGCAAPSTPADTRAAPNTAITQSSASGAPAPAPASAAKPVANNPVLLAPPAAGSSSASAMAVAGCTPGNYVGMYDIGILGTGPITFTLVAADTAPMSPGAPPCQEFCPDLVVSSDSGNFYASWDPFVGEAKLKGGLDCETGQFKVEMVDGKYGLSANPNDPMPKAPADGSPLTGSFTGKFSSGSTPSIAGAISCDPSGFGILLDGMFTVMLSK